MKKLAILALLTSVMAPTLAWAEYKALLKSGEVLYASDYWIDKLDNQLIRLDINGRMERMPRDQFLYIAPAPPSDQRVRTTIRRITFAPKKKPTATDITATFPPGAETTDSSAPALQPPAETEAQIAEESWLDEAERIDRERETAKTEFKEALVSGDVAIRQQSRQKILDLTEARAKLLERIRVANKGVIPRWWRWKEED